MVKEGTADDLGRPRPNQGGFFCSAIKFDVYSEAREI